MRWRLWPVALNAFRAPALVNATRLRSLTNTNVTRCGNAIAAVVLAAFAALWLSNLTVIWNPGAAPDFGFVVGTENHVITLTAGSSAEKAGLKLGDIVNPATLNDAILFNWMPPSHPAVGQRVTITVERAGHRILMTVAADPAPRLSAVNIMAFIISYLEIFVGVALGLMLVLARPSRMLWGFYLVTLNAVFFYGIYYPFGKLSPTWLETMSTATAALEVSTAFGFLIFCLRFPSDTPTGWRARLDSVAPYALIIFAALTVWINASPLDGPSDAFTKFIVVACVIATLVGSVSLALNYASARGPDRHRIKWVVLGTVCAFSAILLFSLGFFGVYDSVTWWSEMWSNALQCTLYVALPLAVAYAVMRHRVIDVRFVLSRSLVYGTIAAVLTLVIFGLDWLFSSKMPTSRFEVSTIAGVALLIGFTLNAVRQRIGNAADALFFGAWHRTQQRAEVLGDALRRAGSKTDLYGPLTRNLAEALSLASAALFERADDGGFVRVAAFRWPGSTLWHILPDDPLARRARERLQVTNIDSQQWREPEIPHGVARPAIMAPIAAGKDVAAVLLLGAHEDGSGFDPDELRLIRRLCADAGPVYAQRPSTRASQPSPLSEPLGG